MKEIRYIGVSLDTLMDDDTSELRVWIPELSPFSTDNPQDEETIKVSVNNLSPSTKTSTTVKAVSYVVCKYFGNTNISRPNVHVGEHVLIRVFGDNNEYYWDVIGTDDNLRTTEHIKFHISNKPNQKDLLTDNTSYYFEMDSRSGKRNITIKTSKGTGESVDYLLQLDLENSIFKLIDSVGNFFTLKSLEEIFHMQNNTGDMIILQPNNIHAKIAAGDSIDISPSKIEMNASSELKVITPNANFTGNITANGQIKSNINGITLSTHKHVGTGSHYDVNMTPPSPGT